MKEHFPAIGVSNEPVALAGMNAADPATCGAACGRNRLIRFAGTRGRLGLVAHAPIMTQDGMKAFYRGPVAKLLTSGGLRGLDGKLGTRSGCATRPTTGHVSDRYLELVATGHHAAKEQAEESRDRQPAANRDQHETDHPLTPADVHAKSGTDLLALEFNNF